MRLFTVCGVQVRISPLTPLFILVCALTGSVIELIIALVSLALHEAAHTAMSSALGYRVCEIELLPFGFTAKLSEHPRSVWDELLIAAAGPAASLVTALALARFASVLDDSALLNRMYSINFGIAAINLLPAVPLDGGRMARAFLVRAISSRTAELIALILALITGGAALSAGVLLLIRGQTNITLALFGAFLIAGAAGEFRKREGSSLVSSHDRREAVNRGAAVTVRYMVLSANTRCRDTLKYFRSHKYTVILAADADMRIRKQLTEPDIVDRIARYGADAPIYIEW